MAILFGIKHAQIFDEVFTPAELDINKIILFSKMLLLIFY
jgi:hypothetical protein